MTKEINREDYEKRLNLVFDYIYNHLDDNLDLNRLAEIACMSPYHWHRVFKAIYGESIISMVKRLRLHRAAGYLANTSMSIDDIAGKSGYSNVQSFNRIFKSSYGLPPAQFRKNGTHAKFRIADAQEMNAMYDVTIVETPAIDLATIPHQGNYMDIGQTFDKLFGVLASRGLVNQYTRSIGIYYDDPGSVPEEQLRSRAGASIDTDIGADDALEKITIPATRCAMLRHKGPYSDLALGYSWLYGKWLMDSGEEAANQPPFEEYLNDPRTTKPTDLLTDIYLPLN
jgi:AraC family transcriptional regulator